jgi:hypothetical protein
MIMLEGKKNSISFKQSANSGDVIYSLAGIKTIWETMGHKADYYQWLDQKGHYYPGAVHPYGDVMFPGSAYDMLKPLVEAQPYINSFPKWNGENIIVDLDKIRQTDVNMPYGHIARWYAYVFADMYCDLQYPWLSTGIDMDKAYKDTILVNRTQRYHGRFVQYFFLEKYKSQLLFTGMPEEHKIFCEEWNLDIPLLQVKDFLELAHVIESCKFFLGNQSMCFAIAEAMKTPRILETCHFVPNVVPVGGKCYDFFFQEALELYVEKLNTNL